MGLADILAPMMTLLLYVIAKFLEEIRDELRKINAKEPR